MELTKAMIEVLDEDARQPKGALPRYIWVEFNPTEYTRNKGAQIAEIAVYGIDSPILQFVRGQNEKLTMDLFFDTTREKGMGPGAESVTKYTENFYQLVKMQAHTHAPPRIQFTWSKNLTFKAIVESVQQKFNLFNPDGIPLRATLSVTFREYRTLEDQMVEPKLSSTDHSKRRVVRRGDTLNRIAAEEYGDPTLWREIAEQNPNLPSLRRLVPGTILAIPPLDRFRRPIGVGQ